MVIELIGLNQLLNGIQYGFTLFLIASGLTVILGILDVLNLAHGELYAVGAYVGISMYGFVVGAVVPTELDSAAAYAILVVAVLAAALLAALVLVPIGAVIETVFLRPIYDRDEVYQLVMTFALLLVITDLKQVIWPGAQLSAPSEVFSGINQIPTLELFGVPDFPSYRLMAVLLGLLVGLGLFYFFSKTKTGRIIRATAIDREMATALGVSTERTFTLVFALGAFLAGFAGAIAVPPTSATLEMGTNPLVLSFVVIVIGGLGSLRGALVGALLVGVLSRWMVVTAPQWEIAAPFIIMIVVLLVKPEGLFGSWGERT
jgi:branched-chain amino acid transport system permease protein